METTFYSQENYKKPIKNKSKNGFKTIVEFGLIRSKSIQDLLREKANELKKNKSLNADSGFQETIHKLTRESHNIETVKKERVFDSEITEEEMDIIAQRVALQQKAFMEFQKRESIQKIARIKGVFSWLSKEEITTALEDVKDDEQAVILNFTQPNYLHGLRKQIATKYAPKEKANLTLEQREKYNRLLEKRRFCLQKKATSEKPKFNRKLRLDEALEQLEKVGGENVEKAFEGWSEARIRSYQQIDAKPNSYYYRFNAPGEKQRNGPWTTEEKELFMKRLKEMGADGQWGIFSMAIPGRVGYQCSNYYRYLITSGEVQDDNYCVDENGKLRYLFGKKEGGAGTIRTHCKVGSAKYSQNKEPAKVISKVFPVSSLGSSSSHGIHLNTKSAKSLKRRRRKKNSDEDEDDEDYYGGFDDNKDGTFFCKTSTRRSKEEEDEEQIDDNPLPGFIDPITLDDVIKPAISPYGHVMGYDTWTRCLSTEERKNICPMTKKPLTKRELVILTFDNIDFYREKIVNI